MTELRREFNGTKEAKKPEKNLRAMALTKTSRQDAKEGEQIRFGNEQNLSNFLQSTILNPCLDKSSARFDLYMP